MNSPRALIVSDPAVNVKAVIISEGFVMTGAGSGTLGDFALWAEKSGMSLDELKSSISDPSLRVLGPVPVTMAVLDEFRSLAGQQEVSASVKSAAYHDRINSAIDLRLSDGDLKALGLRSIGRRARRAVRDASFDADAFDADGDGNLQDGTRFERPAGPARRAVDRVVSAADRFERHQQGQFTDSADRNRRRRGVASRIEEFARGAADRVEGGAPSGVVPPRQRRAPLGQAVERAAVAERLARARERLREIGPIEDRLEELGARIVGEEPPVRRRPVREVVRDAVADALSMSATGGGGDGPRPSAGHLLQRSKETSDARLGRFDESGFGIPQVVEVGNAGIDSREAARDHLKSGGDLADVPDQFLADAILYNRTAQDLAGYSGLSPRRVREVSANLTEQDGRFVQMGSGGGVNGMIRVYDRQTDQFIGIKFDDGRTYANTDEGINEMLGAHVAERLGFANGAMRWGGPRQNATRPIVVEMVQNYAGEDVKGGHDVGDWYERSTFDDLVSMTLLDFAVLNSDRHGGNYFLRKDEEGRYRFVPIDHGLGFDGRRDDYYGPDPTLDGWLGNGQGGSRNGVAAHLRRRLQTDDREQIVEAIKRAQQQLVDAESATAINDAMEQIVKASSGRANGAVRALPERLQWIMDTDAEEIASIIERAA